MLIIKRYKPEDKAQWNSFIEQSKNGTFLFDRGYMDYHQQRFDDHSLMVFQKNTLVAVLPANQVDDEIHSHQGLSYGGLITDRRMKAAPMLALFESIVSYFQQQGIKTLYYKAMPTIYHQLPADEDLYALYRMKAQLYRRDLSCVITPEREVAGSSNFKRNCKKAIKAQVQVRYSENLDVYHRMLTEVLKCHDTVPVHSVEELVRLKTNFPDNIQLIGAFDGETLLAGSLLFKTKTVVHTQYLASSEQGRTCGALDQVIFSLIATCAEENRCLSFGVSTENNGHRLNEGLMRQKEGFGGRSLVHDFYRLPIT
ncbi:hypothetical protein [Candidatus Sororendozoicomonas aggregata]|uniref:hypothetical protein n=1 Tax=Candidatus Sororendozoicomonas aggregata TaxID=3073239 RepID=UPI002ED4D1CA